MSQYEKQEVNLKIMIISLLGFALLAGFSMIVSGLVLRLFSRSTTDRSPSQLEDATRLPPTPRLQTDESDDLARLRAEEDEVLRHYGWVDRKHQIVHIPIDLAMDKVLEQGLPTRMPLGRRHRKR